MTVLLVEDNREDALLVQRALAKAARGDFALKHVGTLTEALAALAAETWDALLVDLNLLDSSGANTVIALVTAAPQIPVIVLTGSDNEAEEAEAMLAGAEDYLVKGETSGPLLVRAIRHAVERHQLARAVRQTNAELRAANEELEAFGYSVSHDLRGPLRAIDGFSALLLREFTHDLPPKAKTYLEHLAEAAGKMNEMVTALMGLSRIGTADMEVTPIDLAQLVEETLAALAPDIEASHAQIVLGPLPGCIANRALLKQVLQNLLNNALKYSRQRQPPRIAVGSEQCAGETVYFVRDNGVGFDMKYAARLFGVFERLHRVDEFEGTGVGLAIVRRIIKRHGGRVWAEAAVDQGATFHFTVVAPVPANKTERLDP